MLNETAKDSCTWNVVRLTDCGQNRLGEDSCLAIEDVLTLEIQDVGSYTLMCTPSEVLALAVGFAFTEGLIETIDDIGTLSQCPDEPLTIRMQRVGSRSVSETPRNLIVSTACGMCGGRKAVEEILSGMNKVSETLSLSTALFPVIMEEMRKRQTLYLKTGGAHAAAIFDKDGQIVSVAEDVGRHNALDKAIGKSLLARIPLCGKGVALSGRVSLEMVSKAARAGLELIAAVSAPSSLGVESADRCNITLCALVRGDKATVYTHPKRLVEMNLT